MITIVPYVGAEDTWTIHDETVKRTFDVMFEQELHTVVFVDGSIKNRDEFLAYAKSSKNLFQWVLVNGMIAGVCWLNNFAGKQAFGHFCFFADTWGKYTKQMGLQVINYWFDMKMDETPILDIVFGIIPNFNKKAIGYVESLGFVKMTPSIPEMIHCKYRGEKCDATLLFLKRSNSYG